MTRAAKRLIKNKADLAATRGDHRGITKESGPPKKISSNKCIRAFLQAYDVARILNVPVNFFYGGLPQDANETDISLPPVMEFMSSSDGHKLAGAYMKIKDAKVRKRVLDLVKILATEEEQN